MTIIFSHVQGPDKFGPRQAEILGSVGGFILYHRLDIKTRRDADGRETPHRFMLPVDTFFQRYTV